MFIKTQNERFSGDINHFPITDERFCIKLVFQSSLKVLPGVALLSIEIIIIIKNNNIVIEDKARDIVQT